VGDAAHRARRLHRLVTCTLLLGALLGAAVLLLPQRPMMTTDVPLWLAVAVLVALAALSEVAYVRVPHGESTEDLTFFEAVVVTAAIVLPPAYVLLAALAGLATACVLLRRPLVKTLFNIGTYAAGTSMLLIVSHGIVGYAGDVPLRLDALGVLALLVGTAVFAVVNLIALGAVLAVVEGRTPSLWLKDEWATSAIMVVGSVGVGAVAVELAVSNPVLLPFTGLPVLALMRSYRATQDHARARERAYALVELNTVLSAGRGPDALVADLSAPLRRLFSVDEVHLFMPGDRTVSAAHAVVVPLDLGDHEGRLVLETDPARHLKEARPFRAGPQIDAPMLGAVASAVASVLRAGRHLAALTEESSKLQAVIDHGTDGIAVVQADGEILVWSPSMSELVGASPGRVEGDGDIVVTLLSSLSTDPARTALTLAREIAPARQRARTAMTIISVGGDEREVEASVARITGGVGLDLAVVTLRDATQERRLEKMKSDFVATVSHELRTPITPIKGYARLLASKGDRMEPARRLHALQLIEDRADHLSRLVDDLLLASRVVPTDPGKLKVDLADVDLRNVVRQATSGFPMLNGRLDVRLPSEAVPVHCDAVRAVQCVANLVGNAEKYSKPDTPVLVELLTDPGDSFVRVVVTDVGRGIPAHELGRIFERFHRVEDPMTMETGGSGLGLYIARELARAMGGDIAVISTLGEGSSFAFSLPKHSGDSGTRTGTYSSVVA
jgi:PAS domain S-box-containing protein